MANLKRKIKIKRYYLIKSPIGKQAVELDAIVFCLYSHGARTAVKGNSVGKTFTYILRRQRGLPKKR